MDISVQRTVIHKYGTTLDENEMGDLRYLVELGKTYASEHLDSQTDWNRVRDLADKILGKGE